MIAESNSEPGNPGNLRAEIIANTELATDAETYKSFAGEIATIQDGAVRTELQGLLESERIMQVRQAITAADSPSDNGGEYERLRGLIGGVPVGDSRIALYETLRQVTIAGAR